MNSEKMNEIENARKLQNDCVNAHMIPPILGILEIEKTNIEGKKEKHIHQKSNSYVRNAYNTIAYFLLGGYRTQLPIRYDEGGLGFKLNNGTLHSMSNMGGNLTRLPIYTMKVGGGNTIDTIDDFKIESPISITQYTPTFNHQYHANKLVAIITTTFLNNLSVVVNISEVGVFDESNLFLMIRDVFETVSLQPGETITVKYTLELVYP